jgi:hypothetical protein
MKNSLLAHPLVARLRRNHALEHATIHVLSSRHPNLRVMGRSTLNGFVIYGDLPTESILSAAQQGLRQLQAGRRELALHPNCGTNLVSSGLAAGLGAFVVLTPRRKGWREWLNRFPLVVLASMLGVRVGQRLGTLIQARITTDADVSSVRITGIAREQHGSVVLHRVTVEAEQE